MLELIPYRDVILVKKSRSLWGGVVKWFLRSDYLHSEYVVDDWLTFGTDLSRPAGVHPFGYRRGDYEIFRYYKEVSLLQKVILKEELQKATARTYDWQEALCLGLGLGCRGADKRYICISVILKSMEQAGMIPKGTYRNYRDFSVFTNSPYFFRADEKRR